MKRFLPHISALILIIVLVVSSTHVAQAGLFGDGPLFGYSIHEFVISFIAELVNLAMGIAAWLLALSGSILNMSINITLNIKEFLVGTPAVYTVWKAIRDISGMFMIFTLLFAGIKMILAPIGIPGPSAGSLIKTVVIAGILINFSFFVAALGIDVSNVVSVQLYNAIAPANTLNYTQLEKGAQQTWADGGISDIFMKSLKISNFYDAKTASLNPTGASNGTPGTFSASLQIILGGVFGVIVMITAAISFFLAALAFIVRFVILIMLLGFSPIWFAAYAIPDLKTYADKWFETYKGQLLFMPIYLLLMYFALSVLTTSNLITKGFATNQIAGGNAWWGNFMVLGINAAFVIIMLNAPLLAAIKIGAMTPGWAKNVGAGAIWKKVGGFAGGYAGRKTIGWAGAKADGYLARKPVGNSLLGRDLRSVTTGAMAKGKFGSARSYEDEKKELKEVGKKSKELDRTKELSTVLRLIKANQPLPEGARSVKDIIGSMGEKEVLALGKDTLTNKEVMRHLKKQHYEAIKKSEDISLEDQQAISKQRTDTFKEAVADAKNPGSQDLIKDMMKNYDATDIAKMEDDILTNEAVITHMSADHLKKISDGETSSIAKKKIGEAIINWKNDPLHGNKEHRAVGHVRKNSTEWLNDSSNTTPSSSTPNPSPIVNSGFTSPNPPKFSKKY